MACQPTFINVGVDTEWEDANVFSDSYWKRCIIRVGVDAAEMQLHEVLVNCSSAKAEYMVNRIRRHFRMGLKQAGPVLRMRAKMAEEEAADHQRTRNAERNRKKREARKRSKQ
tara:strand:- start:45 stop:383 length:339 start_codon:yes stop_codon:yes gene_type:complete